MTAATNVTFRKLTPAQFPEAAALLTECGLPTSDLRPDSVMLLGAIAGDTLVGTIGLERLGTIGLVRSLAVRVARRGSGLAHELYERLLVEAGRGNVEHMYCLTNTADRFFTRRGFELVDRAAVPDAVRGTAQFSELCPSSTRVYARSLRH